MPIFSPSKNTVRPPLDWKQRGPILVMIFLLATAAVFLVGWVFGGDRDTEPARATATAAVEIELADDRAKPDSLLTVLGEAPWMWIDGVRQQVAGESRLAALIDELGVEPAVNPDETHQGNLLEELPGRLEFEQEKSEQPNRWELRLTYHEGPARVAAALVNRLGEDFAASLRESWQHRVEQALAAAEAEKAEAAQAVQRADAAIEAFRREMQQKTDRGQTARRSKTAEAHPLQPATPTTVENPDWAAVYDEIEQLKLERAELLVSRTDRHPAVLDVDDRIASLKRQLDAIPRSIVIEAPVSPAPEHSAAGPDAIAAEEHESPKPSPENLAALARLERTAAEARHRHQRASDAEASIELCSRQLPSIRLAAAEAARSAPSQRGAGIGWLLASLAAGLATAVGVGLTSTGLAIGQTLDSAERIETVSSVPVLAVIPRADASTPRPSPASNRAGLRAALIGSGVFVMLVCGSVVAAALL